MAEEKGRREEEVNRLFYLQSLYNQQYEALMEELTTFGMAEAAVERNLSLLEKKDQIKGSNVLMNAEGGTYIEASVKEINKIMTYVGAGYLVEKNVEQAKEYLKKSMESSRGRIKQLAESKKKLEEELMKIQYAIESMQRSS